MKIACGRRYRVRNGSVVIVEKRHLAHYKDGRTGKPRSLVFFTGQFVGHTGDKTSWQADGKYSPIEGNAHQLDIVGTAR